MNKSDCVIGVDIGASFIKGAILDLSTAHILSIVKIATPSVIPSLKRSPSGYIRYELDADVYVKKVHRVINSLLKKCNGKPEAILFSGQMHGMLLVGKDNHAVTPFYGWQDERVLEKTNADGMTWMDIFYSKLRGMSIKNTGLTVRPGLSGLTLFWLKEHKVLDQFPHSVMLTIGDYVAARLTGGQRFMHPTQACGTLLFDVVHNCWDRKILKALGIPLRFLPTIANSGDTVGRYCAIPVYPCIGDLQAAILGSDVSVGTLSINIGTGSQVSTVSKLFQRGEDDVRSYVNGLYLHTVSFIPAGRALNVIIRFLESIGWTDVWTRLNKLVRAKSGSNGLKARISFFPGNATGFDSGLFDNITEKNWTVSNIFYAVLENMVENYWAAYKRLNPKGISRIVLSGGLARKMPLLKRLIREKFRLPISLAPNSEEALVGLCMYLKMNKYEKSK